MAKVIGIDLGTTNSAVAVLEGGEPSVLESATHPTSTWGNACAALCAGEVKEAEGKAPPA